jgi:hypothetical protein
MRGNGIKLGLLGILGLFASTAYAGYGDAALISELETQNANKAYRVWTTGLANNGTNDPNNCQTTGATINSLVIGSGLTEEARELIARTLLSAHLSGRMVKFNVDTGTCSGTSPVYVDVSIQP